MADDSTGPDLSFLSILADGGQKALQNAEELFCEAYLLSTHGAVERALFLHQISLEECSKIENLGVWAFSLIAVLKVNQEKILFHLIQHKHKNKTNAHMLNGTLAEKEAKARGDWGAAMIEFREFQEKFHKDSNGAKNASLYVDWGGDSFVSPSDKITSEMLADTAQRNAAFLETAKNSALLLQRVAKNPENYQDLVVNFIESSKKIQGTDINETALAMNKLTQDFLETGRERMRALSQKYARGDADISDKR